jgi:hypothetical protein
MRCTSTWLSSIARSRVNIGGLPSMRFCTPSRKLARSKSGAIGVSICDSS